MTEALRLYNQFEKKINKCRDNIKAHFSYYSLFETLSLLRDYEKFSLYDDDHRSGKLFSLLCRPSFLLIAFSALSKKGERSPGVDGLTLPSVTLGTIIRLSKELQSFTYKPKPAKRVYIPKGSSKRPIGIPCTRDKIVQMALLLLIEPIFDQVFHDVSHGFRKGLSCHTCLRHIRNYWKSTS